MQTEINTKEVFRMARSMAKASTLISQALFTLENGVMTKKTVRVVSSIQMETNTKEVLQKE
jgi:hypothetical protein